MYMNIPITQFFLEHHFNAFLPPKPDQDDDSIRRERLCVREALIALDQQLWPFIDGQRPKWDLHRHHQTEHFVSSDHFIYLEDGRPIVNKIGSMWLHYGKSHDQLNALRELGKPASRYDWDEFYDAFYLHTRIQVYINSDVIRCWLIFTDKNYYDKAEFLKKIRHNQEGRELFWKKIEAILGKGYFYEIDDRQFPLDNNLNKDAFFKFVRTDRDGYYSGIVKEYLPLDPLISRENIGAEMKRNLSDFYPIYDQMAYRLQVKHQPQDLGKLFQGQARMKKGKE